MRKKINKGPKLLPAIVNLDGVFYIPKVTDTKLKVMLRLLAFCDNGKGGKTRFNLTTPINLSSNTAKLDFQRYILSAEKNWKDYKPMKFTTEEEAKNYLAMRGYQKFDSINFD